MTLDKLIEIIGKSHQHRFLYHFSDEANFTSINEKGLISKATMRAEGWWPDAPGGNQLSWTLDTKHGIDPYVSLCFTTNHSMKFIAERDGRLKSARYLAISPNILKTPGTKIAFGIANANNVEILPIEEAIEKLDIEVIYSRTNWSDPAVQQRLSAAEKFEVLVPHAVPRNLIEGIM